MESLVREAGYDPENPAADCELDEESAGKILDALAQELSEGSRDLSTLVDALGDVTEGEGAQDHKVKFRVMALDHVNRRRASERPTWDSLVPEARRLAPEGLPRRERSPAIAQDSASVSKFERMFPTAARIKI